MTPMAIGRRWRARAVVLATGATLVYVEAPYVYVAAPYVRAASLVVRIAHVGGRVEQFAAQEARSVTVEHRHAVATRGSIRAK